IEIFIYKIPTRNITIIVAESIFVLLIPCHIYVSDFISLMIFPRIAFPVKFLLTKQSSLWTFELCPTPDI
ncbi:hypothetical protein, partial [Escherichia coli]|uniref:hypothetical protein n=1 Tax=Escherichia coli TaxID=562 RepID=UPI000A438D5C